METGQVLLSRLLPKTGQEIEYEAGDDGTHEAGWWRGLKIANNRERLVLKTIGTDKIVIDRATGLMWAADGNAAGCSGGSQITWVNAVAALGTTAFAGFTDWRLPNIRELSSLINYSIVEPCISEPPFSYTKDDYYWSSTTYIDVIINAWVVQFETGNREYVVKSGSQYARFVRGGL